MKSVPTNAFFSVFGISVFVLTLVLSHAAFAANDVMNDSVVIASSTALSPADMNANRGSGGTTNNVVSSQTLNSTSSGNSVIAGGDLKNGPITIGNNFGGSGFGSYVMNTGNNANISSGVSLSVLMQQ